MSLFEQAILLETQKASAKELDYTCSLISKTYNEWRKIRRRINAVDIISTTVNRIIKVHPNAIDFLNDEFKMKVAIILMRCMDVPYWKGVESKSKVYEKLYPLIKKLENFKLNTGTGGTLREIIMTRLSAAICQQDKDNSNHVFVGYEPLIPKVYIDYLFGKEKVGKIYKMQALRLPEDYSALIELLTINLEKAIKKSGSITR